MKIMTKLNLISVGIAVVMTVSVLGAGTLVINDILYKLVLLPELENASKTIFQELNRSGVRAAAAESMAHRVAMKSGMHTARLVIIEAPDKRIILYPEIPAGERIPFDFMDDMFRREQGVMEYPIDDVPIYAVFATVQPIVWLLSLSISKNEMSAKRGLLLREAAIVMFIVLFLNALLASLLGRNLLKRIATTASCVSHIERGVERHGRCIWIEDAPCKGATFGFILARQTLDTQHDRLETEAESRA